LQHLFLQQINPWFDLFGSQWFTMQKYFVRTNDFRMKRKEKKGKERKRNEKKRKETKRKRGTG